MNSPAAIALVISSRLVKWYSDKINKQETINKKTLQFATMQYWACIPRPSTSPGRGVLVVSALSGGITLIQTDTQVQIQRWHTTVGTGWSTCECMGYTLVEKKFFFFHAQWIFPLHAWNCQFRILSCKHQILSHKYNTSPIYTLLFLPSIVMYTLLRISQLGTLPPNRQIKISSTRWFHTKPQYLKPPKICLQWRFGTQPPNFNSRQYSSYTMVIKFYANRYM